MGESGQTNTVGIFPLVDPADPMDDLPPKESSRNEELHLADSDEDPSGVEKPAVLGLGLDSGVTHEPGADAILPAKESEVSSPLQERRGDIKSNGFVILENLENASTQALVANNNAFPSANTARPEWSDFMSNPTDAQNLQVNSTSVPAKAAEDSTGGMPARAEALSSRTAAPVDENQEDSFFASSTLIQDLGPLDAKAPGEMLLQSLDPFSGLGEDVAGWLQGMRISPWLLGAAAGVLAVEIARRWRNRPSEEMILAAGCERVTLTWFPDSPVGQSIGDKVVP
jgi:hypothetical protein